MDLDREFLTIEATGDYAAANEMIKKYVVIRPEVQKALDKMKSVPNDIRPHFVTANSLAQKTINLITYWNDKKAILTDRLFIQTSNNTIQKILKLYLIAKEFLNCYLIVAVKVVDPTALYALTRI